MKKISFTLCLVLISILLFGCKQSDTADMPTESPLVTQIKKIDQKTGKEEILELTYDASGNLLSYRGPYRFIYYSYGKNGNRLSRRVYYANGQQSGETTYRYSSEGLLLSTEGWSYSDWNLKSYGRTEYQYDTEGNLLGIKRYSDGDLFSEQSFDAQGNLLEERIHYGGEYDTVRTCTYNSTGILLTERNTMGGKDFSGTDYTYSAEGLLLSEISYLFEGSVRKESKTTYSYDNSGNLLQWHISNYQGGPSIYTYTYDASGNCLSEIFSSPSGSHHYQWTYDSNGRKLTEKRILDHETREYAWEYDAQGNVIRYEAGVSTQNAYTFTYRFASVNPADAEETARFIKSFTYSL